MLLTRATRATRATRIATGLLCCGVLSLALASQATPVKRALPKETLFFITAPDLDTSITEFQKTPLALMWKEAEVQEFAEDAVKMAQAEWEKYLAQAKGMHEAGVVPFDPEELLELRVHSLTIAVTRLKLEAGEFGIILHADLGETVPLWKKLILYGVDMAVESSGGQAKKEESKIGAVEMVRFVPPQWENSSMSINVAFIGTSVLIGTLENETRQIVTDMLAGKSVLTDTARYKATAKHLDLQGAEAEIYLRVDGIVDFLLQLLVLGSENIPEFPESLDIEGVGRAVEALGLRSIEAVGTSSRYEGKKSVTKGFVLSPEDQRKGLAALSGSHSKKLDLDFLRWVPKDAAHLEASTLDTMAIHDGIIGAIKAYNPEQADMLLAKLAELEQQAGLNLKNDLFGAFGDRYILWTQGVTNLMSAPEGALLLKVKDQQALLNTLRSVAQMSQGCVEILESERRGVKTYRLEVNPEKVDSRLAMGLAMFQPSFAFKNGYLIGALSKGDVRRAFKRMDREDDPAGDIRSNPEFSTHLANMQQLGVSSFSWTDWKNTFENLYTAGISVLAFVVNTDEVPFDLTLLPEGETLSQHLFASMTWSSSSKDGYMSTQISPVGPEIIIPVVLATAAGVGAALVMPNVMARAPERAVRDPEAHEEEEEEEVIPPKKKKGKDKDGSGK